MKIQESAENYLETILVLKERKGLVRSIDIANELEFSKPSVSIAMRNLRENGYVSVDAGGFITLLPAGQEIAERIYERHRLLTKWLTGLGVDPAIASEDACRIEHVISAGELCRHQGACPETRRRIIRKYQKQGSEAFSGPCFCRTPHRSGRWV